MKHHIVVIENTSTFILAYFFRILFPSVGICELCTIKYYLDSQMASLAAPNPPSLTATPLYASSGGLLKITSRAVARVSNLYCDRQYTEA